MADLMQTIRWNPAYDDRANGGGIHGAEMLWLLKGPLGVVQFLVFTNWFPQNIPLVAPGFAPRLDDNHILCKPMPADLGYHSYTPRHIEQKPMSESCPYLNNKPCYYDGSALQAESLFDTLLRTGHEAAWEEMEAMYHRELESNHDDQSTGHDK